MSRYGIVIGADPSTDWRAPYVHWSRNRLMACAAALEELAAAMETNSEAGAPDYVWDALGPLAMLSFFRQISEDSVENP